MMIKKLKLPHSSIIPLLRGIKFKELTPASFFVLLLLTWPLLSIGLRRINIRTGAVDQSIWQLLLLTVISFMLICGLCWWLLQHAWMTLGLPALSLIVSQFNTLSIWHQLIIYLASFVSLLLAASFSLIAIC